MRSSRKVLTSIALLAALATLVTACGALGDMDLVPAEQPPAQEGEAPSEPAPEPPPAEEPAPEPPPAEEPAPEPPPAEEPPAEAPPPADQPAESQPQQSSATIGTLLILGIGLVVVGGIVIGGFLLLTGRSGGDEPEATLPLVPITSVADDIKAGTISTIVVSASGDTLTITRTDGVKMVSQKEPTADLVQLLTNLGVTPEMLSSVIIQVEGSE